MVGVRVRVRVRFRFRFRFRVRIRVRVRVAAYVAVAFSVWVRVRVVTVRGSGHPRGMLLVTRMQELQAEEQRRETQWHPRVCKFLPENAHRTAAATR
jgi:hypothetical protein